MAWRKWLVRTLVFSVVAGLGAAGYLYQRFTNPAAIREQLVDKLQELLPGANITLDSASLSLFGGIHIQSLQLSRRDDPDRIAFASVPSAVIYHDKEQLLDGKLLIRKIELLRPRLRVVRGKDGRVNIGGDLFSKPHPELAIPTIVVRDATVLIEDYLASPTRPAIEIKVTEAIGLNDPIEIVKFRLRGTSELAGPLELNGSWVRSSGALDLMLAAGEIPIKAPLVHLLAAYVPNFTEHARQFEATAQVTARVAFQPASTQAWSHDVRLQVRGGKLRHPQVPLPVEQIEAALHCADGQVQLEQLTARLGGSPVTLKGWARPEGPQPPRSTRPPLAEPLTPQPGAIVPDGAEFEGDLTVERLPLSPELFKELPPALQKLHDEYSPNGLVNLNVHFSHSGGDWVRNCHVKVLDLSAAYHKFPYALEHIHGIFNEDIDTRRGQHALRVALTGLSGDRPVTIVGDVTGVGPDAAVGIDISGVNIVLNDKLRDALRDPELSKLACSFHPTGKVDFQAFIRREARSREFKNLYTLRFHDAALRYDVFPYPLENVSGLLTVYPHSWKFENFQGSHKGGAFSVHGHSEPSGPHKHHLEVEIVGRQALLDHDLDEALAGLGKNPELARTWKLFHPRGKIDFRAIVEQDTGEAPEVDVTATARDCALRPDFFPYELATLSGTFRYAKRWVFADGIRARHGPTQLTLDHAEAFLKTEGGYRLGMLHLRGQDVRLDDELLRALPPELRRICTALDVKEPFGLTLDRFEVDPEPAKGRSPHILWDGAVALKQATAQAGLPIENLSGTATCVGEFSERRLQAFNGSLNFQTATILKQPFTDFVGNFYIPRETLDVLAFTGLQAKLFGGTVYGETSLEFGPTMHYALKVSAANVKLEEFGRANLGNNVPLSGLAYADLFLGGRGTDIQNLEGHGKIDVPSGRLYNLPTFLGLLKVFDLRAPSNVFFDEAHAQFVVKGPKVKVNRLDLFGNPFSLRGQGDLSLYGTDILLDFYAVGARALDYLPPIIKEFPRMFSENLWKIKVRGRLGELKVIQEPVPIVVEPAKNLLDGLTGKKKTAGWPVPWKN